MASNNPKKKLKISPKLSTVKTILTKRGYAIVKKHYNLKEITEIKNDLTVKPYVHEEYGAAPDPYPIYLESEKKIYIPNIKDSPCHESRFCWKVENCIFKKN